MSALFRSPILPVPMMLMSADCPSLEAQIFAAMAKFQANSHDINPLDHPVFADLFSRLLDVSLSTVCLIRLFLLKFNICL